MVRQPVRERAPARRGRALFVTILLEARNSFGRNAFRFGRRVPSARNRVEMGTHGQGIETSPLASHVQFGWRKGLLLPGNQTPNQADSSTSLARSHGKAAAAAPPSCRRWRPRPRATATRPSPKSVPPAETGPDAQACIVRPARASSLRGKHSARVERISGCSHMCFTCESYPVSSDPMR